jgi:hypothetical protein
MDGAVTRAFLARLANIVGSAGTVLLIVHFLSPVEQGYYYTLLSLVSLQIVFELGFSFVVQQLAAHERAHLDLGDDGTVSGNIRAHARLASALRLTLRWYTAAALFMGLMLAPLGFVFFTRHALPGAEQVHWRGPWFTAIAASVAGLWCVPYYSFLEGCGYVKAVAAMQLRQAIAAMLLAWTALVLHAGLFAPALVIVGYVGVGLHFLATHRRLLFGLLRHRARASGANMHIDWRSEVWPFQWRIAVSWMCSYFTVQALVPILFALRGPVEAGRVGMSLSVVGYMSVLALAWTSTKATPFGFLIARREFDRLLELFRRAAAQSMAAFGVIAACALAAVAVLPDISPHLAARMAPAPLFSLFVLGAAANHLAQNFAILLRSFKQEPFLWQSLTVAAVNILLAAALIPHLGISGAAFGYCTAMCAVGLPYALAIFRRTCRGHLGMHEVAASEGSTAMTGKRYARSGAVEQLRQLCRMADFLLLLAALRVRGYFSAVASLRRSVLIELGPGPTRLASLKRRIFAQVIFLDQSDFGIFDPGLRIANFEEMDDAGQVLGTWCGLDPKTPVLFFADHCLEHVSQEKLLPFLHSLAHSGYAACFRVPNTLSARGLHSFRRDETHRTAFEPELRDRLESIGFAIFPWMRWYRPRLMMQALLGRGAWMKHAEEIALCVTPVHAAARDEIRISARPAAVHNSSESEL